MSDAKGPQIPDLPSRSARRIDADVREELRGWIDERASELERLGHSPGEARRMATVEFGDFEGTHARIVREEVQAERARRAGRWWHELTTDVRLAWRVSRRTPLATAILVLTFALGIGATTAIYSAVHAVLMRALPYRGERQLVQLASTEGGELSYGGQVSTGAYRALRSDAPSLAGVMAIGGWGTALAGDGDPESVSGARLSANAFSVLGVSMAHGRPFVAGDDAPGGEPIVILGDRLWRRRYGADPAIVGKTIDTDGVRRRVVGIAPSGFVVPTMPEAELFVPLDLAFLRDDVNRTHRFRFLRVFGRLREGVTPSRVQGEIDAAFGRLTTIDAEGYSGLGARAVPMREALTGELRVAVLVLMGAAATVLLIACANITVVLLTRTIGRGHEFAVRAALGAGRRRIARQLLAESVSLALVGGGIGVAVAAVLLRLLAALGRGSLPEGTALALDVPVLAFAIAITLVCGVGLGLAPAFAGGRDVGRALASLATRTTPSRATVSLRAMLVGGQLALSVALLLSATLLGRSLRNVARLDLGYRVERVLSFAADLPNARYADAAAEDRFWEALMPRLRAIPGVVAVASAGNSPIRGGSSASLTIEGRPAPVEGRPPEVRYATVSDDYFITLGIPLVAGRSFAAGDRAGAPGVVIVNEAAARKFWPGGSPVGSQVRLGPNPNEPWSEVVGVVGNVRMRSSGEFSPAVYVSQRQDHWGGGAVMLRTNVEPTSIAGAVRAAVREVDPLLPVSDLATFEDTRREQLAPRRVPMVLMSAFSIVAVILATLGVYGVGANAVAQRRRELGIRMALGATRNGIVSLVLRDAMRLIALGLALGIPLALVVATRLRELLFEVRPGDPVLLGGVSVGLVAVAFVAALIPATRAARVDPVSELRGD